MHTLNYWQERVDPYFAVKMHINSKNVITVRLNLKEIKELKREKRTLI